MLAKSLEDQPIDGESPKKQPIDEEPQRTSLLSGDLTPSQELGGDFAHDETQENDLWEQASAQLRQTTDNLGKPIDTGIFEIVVGLNAFGFKTLASCEGHTDWGLPYPWVEVMVGDKTTEALLEQIDMLSSRIHTITSEDGVRDGVNLRTTSGKKQASDNSEELKRLYHERTQTDRRLEITREERRRPIRELLAEFYKNRQPARYGLILYLAIFDRIQCLESEEQLLRSSREQAERLKEYRAELNALADFIRKKIEGNND